ncbi:MAG TPA: toll/interleukin-1 receptor domain-containing protein, partial [Devosia sp.]|nr:toll/interleukin-1 receptor domain-containing protein [Devosia sp.]
MSDVFISYKRRLRPRVEQIAAALRDLKIDVWFDAALEPGVSFSAEISHEVRNAGCVLVCWSDDAFPHGGDENGWVLGEASIGRKRGRLVTVTLEETEFDPPWNMIHSERLIGFDPTDFTADRSAWRGMLAAVGRLIERPGLADYDRAMVAGTAQALKNWAQMYPKDVLAEGVWVKVE